MNNIDSLLQAIEDEKPVDAEKFFNDEMLSRISAALDNKKLELSNRLFSPNAEPSTSEEE